jgi:hypothetical protein
VTARDRSSVSSRARMKLLLGSYSGPKVSIAKIVRTDTNFSRGTTKGLVFPTSILTAGKASAKREGIQ